MAQKGLRKLLKWFCNNLEIKLAFSSFKIRHIFSLKDPVPFDLRSCVVFKFSCAGCNTCYIGETCRHLSTRVREHLTRDRTANIFMHLQQSEECRKLCSKRFFQFWIPRKPTPIVTKRIRAHQVGESNTKQAAQTCQACSFVLTLFLPSLFLVLLLFFI